MNDEENPDDAILYPEFVKLIHQFRVIVVGDSSQNGAEVLRKLEEISKTQWEAMENVEFRGSGHVEVWPKGLLDRLVRTLERPSRVHRELLLQNLNGFTATYKTLHDRRAIFEYWVRQIPPSDSQAIEKLKHLLQSFPLSVIQELKINTYKKTPIVIYSLILEHLKLLANHVRSKSFEAAENEGKTIDKLCDGYLAVWEKVCL